MKKKVKNPNTRLLWDELLFKWNSNLLNSPYYLDKLNIVYKIIKKYRGNFLDIGIGVGNLEKRILQSNLNLNLYGIDISARAIKHVKKEIKGGFYISNILKMPFKNNFFDVAAILDVLEHIYRRDNKRALKEVHRVLKKNGGLIVSVPLNEDLIRLNKEGKNLNKHVREYTFDILKKELEGNGFEVKSEEFIVAFKKNYFIKNLIIKFIPNLRKPNLLIVHAIKK